MIDEIKKFLCEQLFNMRDKMKNINLTYLYEKKLDYHTIIVEPTEVFENNSCYHLLEKDIVTGLYKKFGICDILFTEKVDYIPVDETEVVLRLAPLPEKECANMKFNYDVLDMPSFKNMNMNCVIGPMGSYALAA
ncbi:hypothetical protein [uncultured Alistipes sp.]|jgi:hypothetical protein|uniref:hypothetical protein n=2 Tax=Alistipes sp. TaxID=1872444 RepID=UPI00266C0557|nr:hypothetical protein [uncultured Alistipes sp.]